MVFAGGAAGSVADSDHFTVEHNFLLTNNCFHVQKIKRSAICHWPVLFSCITDPVVGFQSWK